MEGLRGRRGPVLALVAAASFGIAGCGSSPVAQHSAYRGLPGDRAPAVPAGVLGATAPPQTVASVAGLLLSTLPGGH